MSFSIMPNPQNSLFPVAQPGHFSPKSRIFLKCTPTCSMCLRIFACAFLHVLPRWIKLLLTLPSTRRCLWTWHSAARSMLSSPTNTICVWGRWLNFAASVLAQKQCVIRSFYRNGRWSCLCAIRATLWKKLLRVSQRRNDSFINCAVWMCLLKN